MELIEATLPGHFESGRKLFRDYAASLDIDLDFQNFEGELRDIEVQYSRPGGVLFLVKHADSFVGCIAIRRIDATMCELKRMYLKSDARGLGYGRIMLKSSIEVARKLGYTHMRLDTLPSMDRAIELYLAEGFHEIEAYRFNPVPGAIFMEIEL